jgi:hypothetical protein
VPRLANKLRMGRVLHRSRCRSCSCAHSNTEIVKASINRYDAAGVRKLNILVFVEEEKMSYFCYNLLGFQCMYLVQRICACMYVKKNTKNMKQSTELRSMHRLIQYRIENGLQLLCFM